jgi:APA family basic amino acid/polyamine antiporter
VATLGEEVKDPRKTIPKAVGLTLFATVVIYAAVGGVSVGSVGPVAFYQATIEAAAPLEVIGREFGVPGLPSVMAIGAVTAMAGVLLNLILGLSRVLLAMGRRGDAPGLFASIGKNQVPAAATIAIGIFVAALALIGSVRTTWSFSAFTVLVYYAITNLCALKLPDEARLYPAWISWAGLVGCLSLAFFVETNVWVAGLALIAVGIGWHWWRSRQIGK